MDYSLPRESFEILVDTFKSKEKAEKFASAIEKLIDYAREKSKIEIEEKKELVKIELKEELKNELVTRELFEERFKSIEERFKSIDARFESMEARFKSIDARFDSLENKFNIIIILMLILISFANPTFVDFLKELIK